MKIKFNTINIAPHTGYGRASTELQSALERLGVTISDDADICINFCMPPDYEFAKHTIGYTPWESTKIPDTWYKNLRKVDDVWTTSNWVASVFRKLLNKRGIFVLPHGIVHDTWVPYNHETKHYPFTFLHVGEPATRKGGDIVLEAWYKGFRGRSDVRLIYKATGIPTSRVKDRGGSIIFSPGHLLNENGDIINKVYSDKEMWNLYASVDCLVYPSRGEGFGLIPFEAIASGLPTILPSNGGTGLFSNLGISIKDSMWTESNQQGHPGLWMQHSVSEIIGVMNDVHSNYTKHADKAFKNAQVLHNLFDWEDIAVQAVDRINQKMRH